MNFAEKQITTEQVIKYIPPKLLHVKSFGI